MKVCDIVVENRISVDIIRAMYNTAMARYDDKNKMSSDEFFIILEKILIMPNSSEKFEIINDLFSISDLTDLDDDTREALTIMKMKLGI